MACGREGWLSDFSSAAAPHSRSLVKTADWNVLQRVSDAMRQLYQLTTYFGFRSTNTTTSEKVYSSLGYSSLTAYSRCRDSSLLAH